MSGWQPSTASQCNESSGSKGHLGIGCRANVSKLTKVLVEAGVPEEDEPAVLDGHKP